MVDKFFAAEIDAHIPTIDLHDTGSIVDAINLFEREIAYIAAGTNAQYIRVIHGIGTGKLKAALLDLLSHHPLVVDYRVEEHGGSTIILL